jgi:hypothetical protein
MLIVFSGCGGGSDGVWVTGKLLKGGAPYVAPTGQLVSVTFVGLEIHDAAGKSLPSGESYWAEVDQSASTFSVPGPERRGIPLGKYRVAVTQKMTREAFNAANPNPKKGVDRETDMLGDKFGAATSPIIREVKGSVDLTIDLDRPTESPAP